MFDRPTVLPFMLGMFGENKFYSQRVLAEVDPHDLLSKYARITSTFAFAMYLRI